MQATPFRGGLTEEWYAIRCYTGSLLFELLLLLLPRANQCYLSQGSVSTFSNHLDDPSVPESFEFALLYGMILLLCLCTIYMRKFTL